VLAAQASNTTVRDIHLELAERYAALAALQTGTAENENDFSGHVQHLG